MGPWRNARMIDAHIMARKGASRVLLLAQDKGL